MARLGTRQLHLKERPLAPGTTCSWAARVASTTSSVTAKASRQRIEAAETISSTWAPTAESSIWRSQHQRSGWWARDGRRRRQDPILGGDSEFEFLYGDSSVGDASVTAAGGDRSAGRGGDDSIFGDNINFGGDATAGRAGGEDKLDGDDGNDTLRAGPDDDRLNGGADTDDCDGEAGTGDRAKQCETPRWRALARPPDPAFVGPSRQGLPPARPSGYGEQPAATDRGPALIAGVDERVADA
jgi:hypothetical protein